MSSSTACAATGARQPPPKLPAAARSLRRMRMPSASLTRSSDDASEARVCSARKPWPTSGSMTSVGIRKPISCASPRRSRPQAASTIAARPRSPRLRRRVSMLPRIPSTTRSGRTEPSCAVRRVDAVPTRAPSGTSRSELCGPHQASRGSARGSTAASARSSDSSVVRSFAECTATSIRSARSASSSSELKTPRPPSSEKLCRRSRSPTVEIGTIATGPRPAARSASAARPA